MPSFKSISLAVVSVGVALLNVYTLFSFRAILLDQTARSFFPQNATTTQNEQPYTTRPPPLKDTRMRVMLAIGCEGSTAVGRQVKEIFRRHGYPVYDDQSEILKPEKNKYYNHTAVHLGLETYATETLRTLRVRQEEAAALGQVLVFKASTPRLDKEPLLQGMINMGAIFYLVDRHNPLDKCVCFIRDCFSSGTGYPVFANNGSRTDLCFERRALKDVVTIKAQFKISAKQCMGDMERRAEKRVKKFGHLLPEGCNVGYEDLFKYISLTATEEDVEKSVQTWMGLMKPMLETLDERIVRDIITKDRNSKDYFGPHSKVIYNISKVEQEIEPDSRFRQFLRLDNSTKEHAALS
jgi:hypothetical protein